QRTAQARPPSQLFLLFDFPVQPAIEIRRDRTSFPLVERLPKSPLPVTEFPASGAQLHMRLQNCRTFRTQPAGAVTQQQFRVFLCLDRAPHIQSPTPCAPAALVMIHKRETTATSPPIRNNSKPPLSANTPFPRTYASKPRLFVYPAAPPPRAA